MEQSFSELGLKMYFVLEDDQEKADTIEMFQEAFKKCEEVNIRPQWITESKLKKLTLVKTIVLVFQKFDGYCFAAARKSNCMVLGPQCILYCLLKGIKTPDGPHPVYTYAMQGITICTSGFTTLQKEDLKKKVLNMGGSFSRNLTSDVTHLVVSKAVGAISEKYSIATERKVPVMQEQWIHESWELSQKDIIHAEHPRLIGLKCPAFLNLKISCTQISKQRKENIKQTVSSKGGVYMPELIDGETDVLIVGIGSGEKFKAAQKWKIPCVYEDWLKESVKAGYSLKFVDYEVKASMKCSTPETDKTFLDPNISSISCATIAEKNVINDTMMSDTTFLEPNPRPRPGTSTQIANRKTLGLKSVKSSGHVVNESVQLNPATLHRTPEKINRTMNLLSDTLQLSTGESVLDKIESITAQEVKTAGAFLDGCQIYLSGFPQNLMDKVRKIINRGGGTRLDQICEDVTHVLVATKTLTPDEEKALKQCGGAPLLVRADWLVACIENGCAVNSDKFILVAPEKHLEPSPLSKKGLQMWQQKSDSVSKLSAVAAAQSDLDLVKQYLPFNDKSPEKVTQIDTAMSPTKEVPEELATPLADNEPPQKECPPHHETHNETAAPVSSEEDEEEEELKIFQDMKFIAVGLPKEETERLKNLVEDAGGLWQQKPADYVIVPVKGTKAKGHGNTIITPFWVEECLETGTITPIEYYHLPMEVAKHNKPLTGCVLAISNYTGKERTYLGTLATDLGALFQEVFAKKKAPDRNAEASTHLLCATPTGDKYRAALKWKLPVVTKDWLLVCAQDGAHISEEPFLLEGCLMPPTSTAVSTNTPKQKDIENVSVTSSMIGDSRVSTEVPKKPVPEQPTIASPISAVPSRLRLSKTPLQQKQPSLAPDSFKTPDSTKIADHSDDFATPTELKPLSQPYTPFTPLALKKQPTPAEKEKKVPVDNIDINKLTPISYGKHWDSKVPGYIATPETPYGSTFTADPSPQTRKDWKKYINSIPDDSVDPKDRKCEKANPPLALMQRKRAIIEDPGNSPALTGGDKKKAKHSEQVESKPKEGEIGNTSAPGDPQSSRFFDDSSVQDMEDCDPASDNESNKLDHPKPQKKNYKFMLTGVDDSTRPELETLIKSLGGTTTDITSFVSSATHIIMSTPARSEKLLASIASGKWVLHYKYLLKSNEERRFVNEEEYEWGNPKAVSLPELKPDSVPRQLADACYRWRSLLQNTPGKGAYSDMTAIVQGRPNKKEAFSRLIVAGGGVVVDVSPPFTKKNLKNVTHCFVDAKTDGADIMTLEKEKIPYLNAMYLNDYLMESTPPTPQQWQESKRGHLNKSRVD